MKPETDSTFPPSSPPRPTSIGGPIAGRGEAEGPSEDVDSSRRGARRRRGGRALPPRAARVLDQVRQSPLPVRVVGAALVGGFAVAALFGALRALSRSTPTRAAAQRRIGRAVGRSLAQELGARVLLGAAGVLGARLAGDVLAPMISDRLSATGDASEEEED